MRSDLGDPPSLPPERLWRSLLPLRPLHPLPCRLRGAEHVPLFVRPVPALAEALARDAAELLDVEQLRHRAVAQEILALVLHTRRGPAVTNPADLEELDEPEVRRLVREVTWALADCAPTYGRSNVAAWRTALRAGAAHPSNLAEANVLASCIDEGFATIVPRPDRYWGVPLRELLDGHWMAYRAARDALKDQK